MKSKKEKTVEQYLQSAKGKEHNVTFLAVILELQQRQNKDISNMQISSKRVYRPYSLMQPFLKM